MRVSHFSGPAAVPPCFQGKLRSLHGEKAAAGAFERTPPGALSPGRHFLTQGGFCAAGAESRFAFPP